MSDYRPGYHSDEALIGRLQTDLAAFRVELTDVKALLAITAGERDKLRAELAEVKGELSVKKGDCAQLCDENAALEADTSELARHVVTVAAQLAEANARVAELVGVLRTIRDEYVATQKLTGRTQREADHAITKGESHIVAKAEAEAAKEPSK